MIDISQLSVGDMVKIVDDWVPGCAQNQEGRMDKYLGSIVTVRKVFEDYIRIEEDQGDRSGGWSWFAQALEPVEYTMQDYEPEDEADFLSSLHMLGL